MLKIVTNLFKHTIVKIAFKSNNTVSQHMRPKTPTITKIHERSGIYKLTCNTCKQAYIGRTSLNLKLRYREHIRYIRNNYPQSTYAQHILCSRQEYGKINDIMTLLEPIIKTPMLIPYEQLFIQAHHQYVGLITEQNPGEQDPLFQLLIDTTYTSHDDTCVSIHSTLTT
jgi:hypothetical protein